MYLAPFCAALLICTGCHRAPAGSAPAAHPAATEATASALFEDVTEKAGIQFRHANGADPRNPLFPETTPAGCAFLDYDNDGWLDILLVQSGTLTPYAAYVRPTCALYHNNGDGTFTDVTKGSGFDRDLGYGHGVAAGDFDSDGYDDVFITSVGGNHLFRNLKGTGKFEDVTAQMGLAKVHSTGYATSAAFGDYDNDGRLDLYVCYYCPWTLAADKTCKDNQGRRDYCSPEVYPMDSHVLYHNTGHGFEDVSAASGINRVKGRGLAVAFYDYDEDGKQDIFVANDLSGNMLWHNEGNGRFVEKGGEVGVRYGSGGTLMAGMGIGIADYNQSGHESLFITNFELMPNMLFKNNGGGLLDDVTVPSQVGPLHMPYLSFGCEFIDYDADGFPDIVTANGHVQMNGKGLDAMKQAKQLLHNERNDAFRGVDSPALLGPLAKPCISRGVAAGDFDNDGRVDLLFTNQNDSPQLERNLDRSGNHWISFKTVGTKSNRDGLHARFLLTAGGVKRSANVRAGSSYLSVSDRRVYFGLGAATSADKVEVLWPSGTRDTLPHVEADHCYIVTEGKGITGQLPSKSGAGAAKLNPNGGPAK